MSEKEIKREYDKLVSRIDQACMFDGRNKGVDIYTCKECGNTFYTRYKDKGVTPFTIRCRHCKAGTAYHDTTISEECASENGFIVHNWVRPSFEWLNKQRKKGKDGIIEHVLQGGLMLEDEL